MTNSSTRLEADSPVVLMKACKNEAELAGMRHAHIRWVLSCPCIVLCYTVLVLLCTVLFCTVLCDTGLSVCFPSKIEHVSNAPINDCLIEMVQPWMISTVG